jgi:hypothetical protein
MTEFKAGAQGESEAQWQEFLSYLFAQSSTGTAATGVLAGLVVSQTATASVSVVVGRGAAVVQPSLTTGAIPLLSDADKTIDVLTANPVGSLPRNDLVIFNADTVALEVVIGTPNASPTDPNVSANHVTLARIRNAANATTIPASALDNLIVPTFVAGTPSPWQDYNPVLYNDPAGTKTAISATKNYARYRYLDAHTVEAQVSISRVAGSTVSSLGVSLPVTGAFRSLDCGTLTIQGSTAPTAQSGIAVMSGDKTMLVPVAYTNGYLSVDPNMEIRFSVRYEV